MVTKLICKYMKKSKNPHIFIYLFFNTVFFLLKSYQQLKKVVENFFVIKRNYLIFNNYYLE